MKRIVPWIFFFGFLSSCSPEEVLIVETRVGGTALQVNVTAGSHYLHDFPLFWFIKLHNAPQMAVWIEDTNGNFIETLYVTEKSAVQGWLSGGGDPQSADEIRRAESLPVWSHHRGVLYPDGLYMPTKTDPLPDSVTGATPKTSFNLNTGYTNDLDAFYVYLEVNHSTDFNESFPVDASTGASNYSGSAWGSGQPALIYSAFITSDSSNRSVSMELIGHSHPNGENGEIYTLSEGEISTATSIISSVTVYF